MPEPSVPGQPESESQAPRAEEPRAEEKPNLIDSATELLQTAVAYVRQETGDVVREKIVLPTQKAGATVGLAIAVALLLVLGIVYVLTGAQILLAQFVGWPVSLFITGGLLIIVSLVVASVRMRSMQK
ncbi:MAG TPA: hypothetical protein VFG89_08040 [Coriobacteriia bacterium]|nr:hypothetical protein [Coriobacteriia bacterium]